jgi:hypothetical protein
VAAGSDTASLLGSPTPPWFASAADTPPITAILGYSELLADIPALSPEDRDNAKTIHQQVHHAQAAVNSLRDTLRRSSSPPLITADKPSAT